jgi:hypothetical protein
MKGEENIYMSYKIAIEAGSARKARIGSGRRSKVLGQITVRYREELARSTSHCRIRAVVQRKTAILHGMSVNLKL